MNRLFSSATRKPLVSAIAAASLLTSLSIHAELELEEVVVTATKREQSAQDVPGSISAIGGDAVRNAQIQDVRDLQGKAPSLSVEGAIGAVFPRFFIRGLGTNDFNANTNTPVAIYHDEVYLNNAYLQGMPAFDLDRLEILRGPQGSLWGKNTTGGAIHFISKKPTYENTGYASLTAGNFGLLTTEAAFGGAIVDDLLAGRISIHNRNYDGHIKNEFDGGKLDSYRDTAVRAQLLYTPTDKFEALVNMHYRDYDGHSVVFRNLGLHDNDGNLVSAQPGYLGDDADNVEKANQDVTDPYLDSVQKGLTLTLNWDLAIGSLVSITAYEEGANGALFDDDTGILPTEESWFETEVEQFSQEFRLSSDSDGAISWIIGMHYFEESLDSSTAYINYPDGAFGEFGQNTQFELDNESIAVFGSVSWDLSEVLALDVGLRWTDEEKAVDLTGYMFTGLAASEPYEYQTAGTLFPDVGGPEFGRKSDSWDEVTGDVTLRYAVAEEVNLYGKYSRGFKAGNYNTAKIYVSDFVHFEDFETVDPEILDAYELGLKGDFMDSRLRLNAALYYYDYTDLQVSQLMQGGSGGFSVIVSNAGEAEVKGFEVEMEFLAAENLLLRASVGYTDSEYTSDYLVGATSGTVTNIKGKPFAKVPEWTGMIAATYNFNLGDYAGRVSTDWSYKDEIATSFKAIAEPDRKFYTADGYWTGNARLALSSPDDTYELALWVKNITDEQEVLTSYEFFGIYGAVLSNPRTYGVTLSTSF